MRLGLICDVHANLAALEVALEALDRAGLDRIVCGGDLVGYGPQPNECVSLLAERGIDSVAGNHDLVALGQDGLERCGPVAAAILSWTREEIDGDTRRHLAGLPRRLEVGPLVVAHGSLDDPWRYLRNPREAAAELAALPSQWSTLVVGHTHHPLVVGQQAGRVRRRAVAMGAGDRWLINPGAVGQSRERRPLVRLAVLDLDRARMTRLALRYDHHATRAALQAAGLPPGACHVAPGRWRGRIGRLLEAVRRGESARA